MAENHEEIEARHKAVVNAAIHKGFACIACELSKITLETKGIIRCFAIEPGVGEEILLFYLGAGGMKSVLIDPRMLLKQAIETTK